MIKELSPAGMQERQRGIEDAKVRLSSICDFAALTQKDIQAEMTARKQLLSQTDFKAVQNFEGVLSDEDFAELKARRQQWREEYRAFEEQLAEISEEA